MKEKLNDYFLNLLGNPTFSPSDFSLVGLSIDNTSLQDKSVYLGLDAIKNNSLFLTNGSFDLAKFDEVYNLAKLGFALLSNIKETEDLGDTWQFYKGNITAPKELKNLDAEFKIEKVLNPLRQQEGFVSFGIKEEPTMSVREIAQTQKVDDNGEWKESPNETWFDNFIHPKALAQYDEDGYHEDPITGKMVEHKKGDKKLNANGTYYYETLNDRSPYGREILSGFDTLTVDGSTLNSLDFFDSDDIDKSVPGSLARAVAQIAPAFIPGLGEWYICSRVLLSMTELIPAFGKALSFNDDNKLFSYLEAFNKAASFSTSDWTKGSEEAGTQGRMWTAETAFKLIADVFTLLAELRWLFKYGSSVLSGLSPKEVSDPAAQAKWIERYIQENSTNEALASMYKNLPAAERALKILTINYARAKKLLMDKLLGAQEIGSKLSLAYMTGITTAGAFGEAKEAGASDIEAALFTLGYTAAEFALLNSDLGKWILPELKSEQRYWQAVARKLGEVTKETPKDTPFLKLKWYQKLFKIGQLVYHNDLGSNPVLGETFGSVLSNMMSEGVEETSEELLLDLSKSLFNALYSLAGSDTNLRPFENVFDRYAMSFIGGTVGGGLAGALPGYRAARYHNSMDGKVASKELVDIILQGKEKEFLLTAYKMTLSDKNTRNEVDEDGNFKEGTTTDNKDLDAKKRLTDLVYNIKDILTANGADMSRDKVVESLKGELRYAQLSNLATEEGNAIWYYLNRYNELSTELVSETQKLQNLLREPVETDTLERKEEKNNVETKKEQNKELIKQTKENIERIKDELQAYKDGRMSDEFIQDALFELVTGVSSHYIDTDPWRYAEEIEHKPYKDIPKERRAELLKEFLENRKNMTNREILHKARLVHILNLEYLADMMENFDKTYFKDKDAAIRNIEEILFGEQLKINIDKNNATLRSELFFHVYDNVINPFLSIVLKQLILGLDKAASLKVTERLEAISNMKGSVAEILGRDKMPTLEELKLLSPEEQKVIIDKIADNVNTPFAQTSLLAVDNLDVYESELKLANRNLSIAKTQAFNLLLIEFLYDPEVKKTIINKLKSAKYLLPNTKLALTDFFTTLVKVEDEMTGDIMTMQLDEKTAKEYLDALEGLPSSPVDEYISNVVGTLRSKGINIPAVSGDMSKLLSSLAKAANVESFNYDADTEEVINLAVDVLKLALVGLESAKTTLNGSLTDLYGFNATVNEIREKRKIKTRDSKATEENKTQPRKLATISADVATLIQLDINRYLTELETYRSIYLCNTSSVLTSHDNTYKIESYFLFDRTLRFIGRVEIEDWEGITELRNTLNSEAVSGVFNKIKENPDLKVTDELKLEITKARIAMEVAMHEFFNKNSKRIDNEEDLLKLLKDIKPSLAESEWILNEGEKGIPEADYVWYLASLAAANPESVLHEYKNSLTNDFAPIAGLEEAIRTTYSFLLKPSIFEKFAKAYNENLPNDDKTGPYLNINTFRSIFIEGMAGTGKSTATTVVLLRMLEQYHPSLLENLVLVSNSKENAQLWLDNIRKTSGLKLENVLVFSKNEYFKKISNNYPNVEDLFDANGLMKITYEDISKDEEGNTTYSKITSNPEGLKASLVIIDEATSLSLLDATLEEEYLKANNIYSIKAGDFDLLGVYGEYTRPGEKSGHPIFLVGTNYIRTHKLGQIIRGNNLYKINDIIKLKLAKENLVNDFRNFKELEKKIDFSYYLDDTGIYGDVIESIDEITEEISDSTKLKIELMLKTLKDGEKLNVIYDNEGSPLYLYLATLNSSGEYAGKISFITTGASLSLEGQYYIVDLLLPDGLSNSSERDSLMAKRAFSSLYTAVTRSKQATLVFDRVTQGSEESGKLIREKFSSTRMDKLVMKSMSQEVISEYGKKRKETLELALSDYKKTPEPEWKPVQTNNIPVTVNPSNDKSEGAEKSDESVDIENQEVLQSKITNDVEGETNMMIHTTMVLETGCEVSDPDLDPTDPNNILRKSAHSSQRIDNINGLIKIGSLGINFEQDGTLSQANKEKALEILGDIRNGAIYGKTKAEVTDRIAEALSLNPEDVKVNFIYKNTYELDKLKPTKKKFLKFFKSIKEKLLGIFNKDGNRELLTLPRRLTIGVEIFINETTTKDGKEVKVWELKLEVPVAMLTSPLTMLNTLGYAHLKQQFVSLGKNLSAFKEWLYNNINNPSIQHVKSMYKMVELYTNYYNFVVRFNDDFVLNDANSSLSGIIHAQTRGEEYFFTHEYDYHGRPVSLEEYRKMMPWRNISEIWVNNNKENIVVNGQIIAKSGDPLVLISDDPQFKDAPFNVLMALYIKLAKDPSEPKRVKRMYLYFPQGTIEDFLYNMELALAKNGENSTSEEIDRALGNKLSAYRLLSFIATSGSNFDSKFDSWIDSAKNVTEEEKTKSKKRWQLIKSLISEIKKAEERFDLTKGTKANQLLDLLDKPINSLPSEIKKEAVKINEPKLKYDVPLRTALLYEFRKLIYSDSIYGPSLSLQLSDISLSRKDGKVIFLDFQLPKIDALLQDALDNYYSGISYHVSLKSNSENVNVEGFSFAKVNAEDDTRISKRSFEINAKLETTAVIRNAEPILDEIIDKGVPFINSTEGISKLNKHSESERQKIYIENTQAYVNGIMPIKGKSELELFNEKLMSSLKFERGITSKELALIQNSIKASLLLLDIHSYLFDTLKPLKYTVVKLNNGYLIVKTENIKNSLKLSEKEILLVDKNDRLGILNSKGEITPVTDLSTLQNLLSLTNLDEDIRKNIEEKLKEFNRPPTEEILIVQPSQIFKDNLSDEGLSWEKFLQDFDMIIDDVNYTNKLYTVDKEGKKSLDIIKAIKLVFTADDEVLDSEENLASLTNFLNESLGLEAPENHAELVEQFVKNVSTYYETNDNNGCTYHIIK